MLFPPMPSRHGACKGSRAVRARAAPGLQRAELSASSRSEPAEVGRGKCVASRRIQHNARLCEVRTFARRLARCAHRFAPFGFAQPALCLAPRPPSALCRVLLAHCAAEVSALVCKHTSAPLHPGCAQATKKHVPPPTRCVRLRARPAAPQGAPYCCPGASP